MGRCTPQKEKAEKVKVYYSDKDGIKSFEFLKGFSHIDFDWRKNIKITHEGKPKWQN